MSTWPISRHAVRTALTASGMTPLRKPTDIRVLEGNARHDWNRFEVPFSRLVLERLPMEVDRNGRYLDDEANLSRQIARSFTELITDMTIVRERWRLLASFTLFLRTVEGTAAYNRRVTNIKIPWSDWVRLDDTF